MLTAVRPRPAEATAAAPSKVEPPSAPPPSPRRVRKPLVLAVAVVLAALVVTRVVPMLAGSSAPVEVEPWPTPTTAAATASTVSPAAPTAPAADVPAPPPTTDALAAEVEQLTAWVEQARGLEFQTPVAATFLDDAAFDERYRAAATLDESQRAEIEEMERLLRAVGLLDPGVGWLDHADEGVSDVLGFYDPRNGDLVVRGTEPTPYLRSVIVHELTHALDDQHFGLFRPELATGRYEESVAFDAVVEGNATRIQLDYIDQLPPAERQAVLDADTDALAEAAAHQRDAQGIDYLGAFPYVDGASFVRRIAEVGGNDAVDGAFRVPPRTSAEVIVPDRYLHHLRGVRLSVAPGVGEVVDEGVFGALGLFMILATAVGFEDAATAAVSWEGDGYVAWTEHDDRTCVKMRFVLSAPWTAELTGDLFEVWAERQIDASVEAPGTVIVQSCR